MHVDYYVPMFAFCCKSDLAESPAYDSFVIILIIEWNVLNRLICFSNSMRVMEMCAKFSNDFCWSSQPTTCITEPPCFFFCSAAAAHNFVQTISAQKDLSILLWLCRATDAQLALAHCICIMWMLLNNDKTLSLQPMEKMRIISVNSKWRGIVDLWWRGKILLGDCITVYAFHSTSKCCVYFFMHAFVPQDGKLCIIITNRSCRITT